MPVRSDYIQHKINGSSDFSVGQKLCHDPSHRTSYDGEKSEEIHTRTERHQNLLGIVALFSDESVTMDVDEQ